MTLIASFSFPMDQTRLAVDRFLGLHELPDYLARRGPYFSVKGDSVEAFAIYEFDPAVYEDVKEYLQSRFKVFQTIDGLEYSMKKWIELDDVLKVID